MFRNHTEAVTVERLQNYKILKNLRLSN